MARIELRHCDILFKDGLAGTAKINEPSTPPTATDTNFSIDSVVLNTTITTKVPVGARFTVAGETASETVHTVTAKVDATNVTTEITFVPALGAGTYADEGALTFLPQELNIKVGDGNLTYTEKDNFDYLLDRGNLDTVRQGNEVPLEMKLECVYEHITTGTGEEISPMDALKGMGDAAEWVSASPDLCEPYAIDIEILHTPPCGTAQKERTKFPAFRSEQRDINFKDATISVSGKCNCTEPVVTRE